MNTIVPVILDRPLGARGGLFAATQDLSGTMRDTSKLFSSPDPLAAEYHLVGDKRELIKGAAKYNGRFPSEYQRNAEERIIVRKPEW